MRRFASLILVMTLLSVSVANGQPAEILRPQLQLAPQTAPVLKPSGVKDCPPDDTACIIDNSPWKGGGGGGVVNQAIDGIEAHVPSRPDAIIPMEDLRLPQSGRMDLDQINRQRNMIAR